MTISKLTLNARPAALHWAALIGATLAFVALFRLAGLPAALLLGAIGGRDSGGVLRGPRPHPAPIVHPGARA